MAPPPAPPGVFPMFISGKTLERYGFKNGEGSMDFVECKWIPKEDLLKEIQTLGVMCDFECGKKYLEMCPDKALFVVDKTEQYGEKILLYYSADSQQGYLKKLQEVEDAIAAQKQAEFEAEEAKKAAELARQTIEYKDEPIIPRAWKSASTTESELEIHLLKPIEFRTDVLSIEVTRPKRTTRQYVKLTERDAEVGNVTDFRAHKDPNFRQIKESDCGFQSAPMHSQSHSQTAWNRAVNKSVQYEAIGIAGTTTRVTTSVSTGSGPELSLLDQISRNTDMKEALCEFLEKATAKIESSLQQNETIDIFMETFHTNHDDEVADEHAENNVRELKNFADPTYSKFKSLPAIDWMPKVQGMVAVSAVRNITFEQRVAVMGQTYSAYVLLWDFKHLVRPQVLMQCENEIYAFRFNKKNSNIVAGGCITGQVILWDLTDAMEIIASRSRRGGSSSGSGGDIEQSEDDESANSPVVVPKFISSIDHCHKRAINDIFWLPPTIQINYRGQIVSNDYLDGNSYQFITVSTDAVVMVWDTRFEQIAQNEVLHIGRAKHVHMEKVTVKESDKDKPNGIKASASSDESDPAADKVSSNQCMKPIWSPIFKAHLKKPDGVGELSLCKVSYTGTMNVTFAPPPPVSGNKQVAPPVSDPRSQLLLSTEEGDIMLADICATKVASGGRGEEEEEEGEGGRDFVKWLAKDHSRPPVALHISPFFPDIALSICDWGFHIWKIGFDTPLFVSPATSVCYTGGAWSPTRPAVLFVAAADGHLHAWDFTDSSYRASSDLHVTHAKVTSLEFLISGSVAPGAAGGAAAPTNLGTVAPAPNRQQLMAIGDESGTLHIFEIPRNLARPVHKEEQIMAGFLEREHKCLQYNKAEVSSTAHVDISIVNNAPSVVPSVEAKQLEMELLKKEDDDYNSLESKFMAELGLQQ